MKKIEEYKLSEIEILIDNISTFSRLKLKKLKNKLVK